METQAGQWAVPASHAVWIPPGQTHGMRSHGLFVGWSVYVAPVGCRGLPTAPRVLPVSALLRAGIERAVAWTTVSLDVTQRRLAQMMLDEIRIAPVEALALPMPQDARLVGIAEALSRSPGDHRSLQAWACRARMAPRTFSRRFVVETGLTFRDWRQRVRMLAALQMLAADTPVTTVALDLGYDNVSAFIAAFKRGVGTTPGRYFKRR